MPWRAALSLGAQGEARNGWWGRRVGGVRWSAGRCTGDRTEASRRKKGGRGRRKGRRKKMSSEFDMWAPQK